MTTQNQVDLVEKWKTILDHDSCESIQSYQKRAVTAQLLENQAYGLARESGEVLNEDAPANQVGTYPNSGGMAKYDPVLIQMVRRSVPKMIAFDVCGVQPLKLPTGLIFSIRSKYTAMNGVEARFNEANTGFSGTGVHAGSNPVSGAYTTGSTIATNVAETIGSAGGPAWAEMSFAIERIMVEAGSRALKAEYSRELEQDLKSVHGLNADSVLSEILSGELLIEQNREVIRKIYTSAVPGAVSTQVAGTFDLDVDANGRWSGEKFKGLVFQMERDANAIGHLTRRGRGNFIICSADVASALAMAGSLDYTPALKDTLNVDDTNSTFAGILNGKYKVYVDPYSANVNDESQFYVMGYKGASAWDAGLYYCPYIPLQKMSVVDNNTAGQKIFYKTRYGLKANPFAAPNGDIADNSNVYFRRVKVINLM